MTKKLRFLYGIADSFRKFSSNLISKTLNPFSKNTSSQHNETPDITQNSETDTMHQQADRILSISQAAKTKGLTRQAIYFAIKMNKLKANKSGPQWEIAQKDLNDYFKNKYSRTYSRKQGQLIFDKNKGFYSINEAAKFLGQNPQQVYYQVRMGRIKTTREGAALVITSEELRKHQDFLEGRTKREAS